MKELYLLTPVVAKVSDEDFLATCGLSFTLTRKGYLQCRTPPYRDWYLHQIIAQRVCMILDTNQQIDHEDTDKLNNQRSNLRPSTSSQNKANACTPKNSTSGQKGVYWHKYQQRYTAQIVINNQRHHLGYGTFEECQKMYQDAAKQRDGVFYNPG